MRMRHVQQSETPTQLNQCPTTNRTTIGCRFRNIPTVKYDTPNSRTTHTHSRHRQVSRRVRPLRLGVRRIPRCNQTAAATGRSTILPLLRSTAPRDFRTHLHCRAKADRTNIPSSRRSTTSFQSNIVPPQHHRLGKKKTSTLLDEQATRMPFPDGLNRSIQVALVQILAHRNLLRRRRQSTQSGTNDPPHPTTRPTNILQL